MTKLEIKHLLCPCHENGVSVGVMVKGKMVFCHPDSWLNHVRIPIQDVSDDILVRIISST